jgi:1-acyl-sn-glycerol-3-phosphate acyltransferase
MMQLLKSAFGIIWSFWGGFWFMLLIAVFTILYAILFLFTGRKYVRFCIWINCRYLCNWLMALTLIRKRVHHADRVDKNATYVFVANHRAQFDTIVAAGSLPQPVFFLAKAELKKIPFFGYMVKMLAIMVDRKSKESREKSVRVLVERLQNGDSIFLFPEGTRNKGIEPLLPFKDGAFVMAIKAQVPIVVQTIVGMRRVMASKGAQLFPGVVDIYWSEPIMTAGMTVDDIPLLKQRVKEEMLKHLD